MPKRPVFCVPESLRAVFFDLPGVPAQIGGIEGVGAGGNVPFRVGGDLLFEIGQVQQGVVVVDRRQGVFAAERQGCPSSCCRCPRRER